MASGHSIEIERSISSSIRRVIAGSVALLLTAPRAAHASLLAPETEDKLATFLAIFVLFLVPIVLIVLFWMVHVLPEKIAHKRQHPQFEAIRTLCLLSLVFGGLLWPLAWLWAYSKPVMYKLAYGTDTHPDASKEGAHAAGTEEPNGARLRAGLAQLEGRVPAAELIALRMELEAFEAKFRDTEAG
jgi:CBS domain containing-hemolysin-like protein